MAREDFHSVLKNLNETYQLGLNEIAYQPKSNLKLAYPVIVYNDAPSDVFFANNIAYTNYDCYTVTVIARVPNDKYKKALLNIEFSKFINSFIKDNLYHYVFTCYHIS